MRRPATITAVVLLAITASAPAAVRLPIAGLLQADGEIDALTRAGSRIVLTGDFRHIGPYVGGALGLDRTSGAPDPLFARLDGQVSDAIPDGTGGWYVGGQFLLNGKRRAVAHLLPSGAVDPAFDARVGRGTFVSSLALADGTLYAGRYYYNGRVAALNATTGAPVEAFHSPKFTSITELEAHGDALWVGTTTGVGKIELSSGRRFANWDCLACDGHIMSLLTHGGRVYVGFSGGGLLAVSDRDGALDTGFGLRRDTNKECATEDCSPMVLAMDGDRLLVGGAGLELGGQSSSLVALDPATGAADVAFARGLENPIHDMVIEGNTLFVAGAPRRNGRSAPVLRLDRATGAYQDALVPDVDGPIDALAGGGKRLFVGGRFGTAHGITTDGVAEVSARTGRLVPGFAVQRMPVTQYRGDPVVAGDSLIFPYQRSSGGADRAVAFSARTGARRPDFDPRPIEFDDDLGDAEWAADGGRVYVVYPTAEGVESWQHYAVSVLSAESGAREAHYALPHIGYVDDVLAHHGQLFVAGSFRRFFADGTPRHLATMAVDPLTGAVDESFDAHTDGPVGDIAGYRDRLYLSGYFEHAYGLLRDGFASVYDNTGAINARFSRRVKGLFDSGGWALGGYFDPGGDSDYTTGAADYYTGKRLAGIPQVRPGYRGEVVLAPRGAFVTASLDFPYYGDNSLFDDYAVLIPYAP